MFGLVLYVGDDTRIFRKNQADGFRAAARAPSDSILARRVDATVGFFLLLGLVCSVFMVMVFSKNEAERRRLAMVDEMVSAHPAAVTVARIFNSSTAIAPFFLITLKEVVLFIQALKVQSTNSSSRVEKQSSGKHRMRSRSLSVMHTNTDTSPMLSAQPKNESSERGEADTPMLKAKSAARPPQPDLFELESPAPLVKSRSKVVSMMDFNQPRDPATPNQKVQVSMFIPSLEDLPKAGFSERTSVAQSKELSKQPSISSDGGKPVTRPGLASKFRNLVTIATKKLASDTDKSTLEIKPDSWVKVTNYGIVGDLYQVLPALTAEFKKRLGK